MRSGFHLWYGALSSLPIGALVLLGLWGISQIAVPIAYWIGAVRAGLVAISIAVLIQAGTVATLLGIGWGGSDTILTVGLIIAIGWGIEFVGAHWGIPFGRYRYTGALQPQIGKVPLLIPLAWLMMLPPAWAMGYNATLPMRIVIAASAMTAWDLFLDPLMVEWRCWKWQSRGSYFGIPVVNFFGWLLTAGLCTALVLLMIEPSTPLGNGAIGELDGMWAGLMTIYVATWLLQSIGMAFIWRLPGPALCGFCGMGIIVGHALVRLTG